MGKCSCHPEKETSFMCLKHEVYLCDECLKCRDPKIYCKHRSACLIWFMQKQKGGPDTEAETDEEARQRTTKGFAAGGVVLDAKPFTGPPNPLCYKLTD